MKNFALADFLIDKTFVTPVRAGLRALSIVRFAMR
jgi:hypothetical protein